MKRYYHFCNQYPDAHEKGLDAIKTAFKAIRHELNAYARYNYLCCSNCGSSAITTDWEKAKNKKVGAVYCSRQAAEGFDQFGTVYLNFGVFESESEPESHEIHDAKTEAFGHKVVDILRRHGLYTIWSGEHYQCIQIDCNPVYGCEPPENVAG